MPTKFNERVAVLLPLYNPEPYLFDQLESLASQDIEKFDLIWGVSKDENNSIPAIDAMCAFTNNYFVDINGLSASNAFFKLLSKAAEYDYVAFCDQDDIWEKSRLSKQVASLKQFENSVALSHSNFTILNDKNFNVVDNCYSHKVDTLLEGNCARGCTMVLNKKLVRTILESPVERMIWHDWWTILIASANFVFCAGSTHSGFHSDAPNCESRSSCNLFCKGAQCCSCSSKKWRMTMHQQS